MLMNFFIIIITFIGNLFTSAPIVAVVPPVAIVATTTVAIPVNATSTIKVPVTQVQIPVYTPPVETPVIDDGALVPVIPPPVAQPQQIIVPVYIYNPPMPQNNQPAPQAEEPVLAAPQFVGTPTMDFTTNEGGDYDITFVWKSDINATASWSLCSNGGRGTESSNCTINETFPEAQDFQYKITRSPSGYFYKITLTANGKETSFSGAMPR